MSSSLLPTGILPSAVRIKYSQPQRWMNPRLESGVVPPELNVFLMSGLPFSSSSSRTTPVSVSGAGFGFIETSDLVVGTGGASDVFVGACFRQ
jgi:hypothetical protein